MNRLIDPFLPEGLETDRLRFRRLELTDVPEWNKFIKDDAARIFLKIDSNDAEASKKWILNQHRRYTNNLGGLLAIEDKFTNTLLGQAGLLVQEIDGKNKIEVGYHLLPSARKKGYATEAALALINYAFYNNINNEIISLIHIDNTASQKVADRNGLKRFKEIEFLGFPVYIYSVAKVNFETH